MRPGDVVLSAVIILQAVHDYLQAMRETALLMFMWQRRPQGIRDARSTGDLPRNVSGTEQREVIYATNGRARGMGLPRATA